KPTDSTSRSGGEKRLEHGRAFVVQQEDRGRDGPSTKSPYTRRRGRTSRGRCRSRLHFSAGGVIIVVAITIATIAVNVDREIIGSPFTIRPRPTLAKISPTSPRGIMPMPTAR